jgi:hypothetical protein
MIILYCYDIKLTDKQVDALDPITQLALRMGTLANDLYSVGKGWETHAMQEKPGLPISSVFLIMRLQGVSVATAMDIAKQKFLEMEEGFLNLRCRLLNESGSLPEVARYLSALQFLVSGSMLWTMQNTRYEMDSNSLFQVDPSHYIADLQRRGRRSDPANGHASELPSGDGTGRVKTALASTHSGGLSSKWISLYSCCSSNQLIKRMA